MAKQGAAVPSGLSFFDLQALEAARRALRTRRQRALFIPKFLKEAARNSRIFGRDQINAHKIVVRWADMESSGKLAEHRETSIDTQFLDQVFGEGLGYRVKTQSPDAFELEHKFSVPGVGIADAALGTFPASPKPFVVIELKNSTTDLDRDRSNGRSPAQQCWDYLNAQPDCPWGIVSNFALIRLYHRSKGALNYEEFSLQELRDETRFSEFYYIFERGGLLPEAKARVPRALALLEKTRQRQKDVGDDLYNTYHLQRLRLIEHLKVTLGKTLDESIRIAQKILDRVIFVAFCEDRELLPPYTLNTVNDLRHPFRRVVNPIWQNLLDMFDAVDKGANGKPPINAFNGGLFVSDPEIDTLNLDDDEFSRGLVGFGKYDFSEEVNVEVLGHLFERSITELEKLRVGGLFALKNAAGEAVKADGDDEGGSPLSKMPKSAQRKRFGIYYTPPAFTSLIVERTIDALVRERFVALALTHGVDPESRGKQDARSLRAYWTECLACLKAFTVCDPACGSGAFLIRAYESLDAHYKTVAHGLASAGMDSDEVEEIEESIPELILTQNLYGVDLSREGVEITQLALWIRSARPNKTLTNLSSNVVWGNSLVSDPAVDAKALDWEKAFPRVFGGERKGFDCVIGNPPWERIKLQEREFFSLTDPQTAQAVSAADRRTRISGMLEANPELHAAYLDALGRAQKNLDYARLSVSSGGRYPLTGKGDVNLYMLFAELGRSIVSPDGLIGLLMPSGIATDDTTKEFFGDLMDRKILISLYDFENRNKVFADVDGRFKFTALVYSGGAIQTEQADFVFFAHGTEEVAASNKHRHITLTAADMKLLNPNTRTCPIFRTRRDAQLTRNIYKRVPILIDVNRKKGGNPWGIKFFTMFHQTNDAEHFQPASHWVKNKYTLEENVYVNGKKRALPLYEAKMVQAYDHRAAGVIVEENNWVRQGQKAQSSKVDHQNPEFTVTPRWWVDEKAVGDASAGHARSWLLVYKDITSATNERTMIAAFLPWVAVVNSAPIMFMGAEIEPRRETCLLANIDSFAYDFVARQKVGGLHLNFFIVEQLPTLPPDVYSDKCPWAKRETLEHWISERVLKLSCTADDMKPLAAACGFEGSEGGGVHKWRDAERIQLRAELDAAFALLYGLSEEDFTYVLTTFPAVPEAVIEATGKAYRELAGKVG